MPEDRDVAVRGYLSPARTFVVQQGGHVKDGDAARGGAVAVRGGPSVAPHLVVVIPAATL
jgi:hypothetical protein